MISKITPKEICEDHNAKAASTPLRKSAARSKLPVDAFIPSPDEVARRAYFTYVNQGSQPGRDVQHWLDAESQLLAERNRTREHGFPKRT